MYYMKKNTSVAFIIILIRSFGLYMKKANDLRFLSDLLFGISKTKCYSTVRIKYSATVNDFKFGNVNINFSYNTFC